MREGLSIALKSHAAEIWTTFQQNSIKYELTDDQHVSWTVYRIRAMLAHLRMKFDDGAADKQLGTKLDAVFLCMSQGLKTNQKKQRRRERIGQRPHPFPFFRDVEQPEADPTIDEPLEVIAKYFTVSDYSAMMGFGN